MVTVRSGYTMQGKVQIATCICAQTIPQKAKPLSFFTNEEGMKHLTGPNYEEAETKPFAPADLKTLARLDDAVIQVTKFCVCKGSIDSPKS